MPNKIDEIIALGIGKREAEELISVSKNIDRDIRLLKKDYPIQYLIGYSNFYGYDIKVTPSVLIPRPETEGLVEETLKEIKKRKYDNPIVMDMCTGSGCIALTIKKELPNSEVYAIDKSIRALNIARENFINNKVKIYYMRSNLFNNIPKYPSKYDVIISNPPYISKTEKIANSVKREPKLALYSKDDGLYHIKKIILKGYELLNDNGFISLEIGETEKDRLTTFLDDNNFKNYELKKDLVNKIRYLFIYKNE